MQYIECIIIRVKLFAHQNSTVLTNEEIAQYLNTTIFDMQYRNPCSRYKNHILILYLHPLVRQHVHYTMLLPQVKKWTIPCSLGRKMWEIVYRRSCFVLLRKQKACKQERKKESKWTIVDEITITFFFVIISPQARRYCHYDARCSLCYVTSCFRRYQLSTTPHVFIWCGSQQFSPFTSPDPAYRFVSGSLLSCYNACIRLKFRLKYSK